MNNISLRNVISLAHDLFSDIVIFRRLMYTNGNWKRKNPGEWLQTGHSEKKKISVKSEDIYRVNRLGLFQYISCVSCCSFLEHLSKNMFWPKLDYIEFIWKVSCNVDSKLKRWECYGSWGWKKPTWMSIHWEEIFVNSFQQILKLIIIIHFWKIWINMFLHLYRYMDVMPCSTQLVYKGHLMVDYRLHNWKMHEGAF